MPTKKTPKQNNHQPVTLVFNHKIKKGKEEEFTKWAHGITHASLKFEGHLGSNWIKTGDRQYILIYKFIDLEHFLKWKESAIRKKFLKEEEKLLEPHGRQQIQKITGLETWFTIPGVTMIKPPPRWKMVIATMIGIYPIGLVYQASLVPYFRDIPLLLRPVALSLILTPLLTYVIMPNLTKLLRQWLYPTN
jgi:uncharacterized protein